MKKNEVILLVITGVLVVGAAVYYFSGGASDSAAEAAPVAIGDLNAAKQKFVDNLSMLKRGKDINARYNQLSVSLEDTRTAGLDPGIAAQNELYKALSEKLGLTTPRIENSVPEEIPNVDEYYFINVAFTVNGSEVEMKKLLRDMENIGFLIQNFQMTGNNHGAVDNVELKVVVSRLVKKDKDTRTRRAKKKGFGL